MIYMSGVTWEKRTYRLAGMWTQKRRIVPLVSGVTCKERTYHLAGMSTQKGRIVSLVSGLWSAAHVRACRPYTRIPGAGWGHLSMTVVTVVVQVQDICVRRS
jgi:hypothetical protein